MSTTSRRTRASTFSRIPFWFGAKYAVADAFYGAAELGLVLGKASVRRPVSASDDNLGLTLGAGYRMGRLDIRAGIHVLDLGNAGDLMELVASVGYNFATF